ncbi:hypothetical protein FPQ18DRAFT_386450 [Pyronema domesticum]|uniref:Similar to RNA-binding post-transcriptional regulator cip2 acc. no. Q09868 n=1 Tax=Pyronema omphalodes (strain CBS 100304) TaxID=1076935 RepID=U4LVJ0_PYROM|nr:hypothetical protein FPQ18DRAFT_386450 [Pyronema domesticum]CCX32586.1 Similar to RNA-binding post-transcriptional regulator cip2; acc. no. Q09868 [Pyronema omphalodes CBS 100304]
MSSHTNYGGQSFGSNGYFYTGQQAPHFATVGPGAASNPNHGIPTGSPYYDEAETQSHTQWQQPSGSRTWASPSGAAALSVMGGGPSPVSARLMKQAKRSPLPTNWTNNNQLSQTLPTVNPMSGMGNGMTLSASPMRAETIGSDMGDEELIPTAIVIKNIPFAVKKEQLVGLMTEISLPLPYAFNYHFDNGVFRGLAFANFTTAEETAAVIDRLNGFELQGRKLRVEYKKMLPIQERERIEREKRERRGQLEEQHRPVQHVPPLATSPTPGSTRSKPDVDLNDPQTLQFYSQLLLFRDDHTREALIFPPTLSPQQRRIVHTLAHHMGLAHISRGNGDNRQVHVFRAANGGNPANISPPAIPTVHPVESQQRRALTRATTMDFTDTRSEGTAIYSSLGRQASALLDIPSSPSSREHILHSRQNLRPAKSFADLRSYTPSPVPSSASFPAALGNNISRYQQGDYGAQSVSTTTPCLTPTATGSTSHNESLLVNGLAGVSLSSTLGGGMGGSLRGDPRDPRGVLSHERERGGETSSGPGHSGMPGGGVTRSFSMGFDEVRAERNHVMPQRQPRGPDSERGAGFAGRQRQHHNGRTGSGGELDVQSGVEIVVE